jgi:hypothetical protein
MRQARPRQVANTDISNRRRVALALGAAVLALIAAAGSALASSSSGGVGGPADPMTGGDGSTSGCPDMELGSRILKLGDCGGDVETLNWILKAKDYPRVPLDQDYVDPTAAAVRVFQREARLDASGVTDTETTAALVNAMPSQLATWYGPGFFGDETACGKVLTRSTMGVAHKTLPCGSKVVLRYKGHFVRTKVIDRGPFTNGAKWDLTEATAETLGLTSTDEIRVAKLARRAVAE